MGAWLLLCRVLLAVVFLVAGAAKLADLEGSRRAVAEFGVPERFASLLGGLLPLGEVAVGVALLITPAARFGAVGAGVLLLAFVAAIGTALAGGREPDCHCFGQVHSAPAGPRTLARNLVLLGLAGFVAIGGWKHPGISATHWTGQLPAAWLVAIGAGAVILALVSFQVWFSLQLMSQNGRVLGRLQALEDALQALAGGLGLAENGVSDPVPLGEGLNGGGLAVGSPAPEFELESLGGDRYSLGSLLAGSRRLMLVFSASGCGPCEALMPQLANWQRAHAGRLEVVLVASGDAQRNRAKAAEYGLERVLLQKEREISDAYQAYGTPTAVVIGADGLIQSPTVGGPEAITALVAQASRPTLAVKQHVPSANGHANGGIPDHVPAPAEGTAVGDPAPELVLSALDGQPVALTDLYTQRTLAIFWNPGCGFCQQMLEDLKAFERQPPPGAPSVVLISRDAQRTREHGLRSRVLIDDNGEAMEAFGAHGTPMAVLIENRQIASGVAAGADAVFALAHVAAGAFAPGGASP